MAPAKNSGAGPTGARAGTGVAGLDEILGGGLPRNQLYLVEGGTGAGKTTLGLQFLLTGAARGERGLYLGFSETPEDLVSIAAAHGWSLDGVVLRKIVSDVDSPRQAQYTLFPASEVELHELTERIIDCIDTEKPDRLVIDPVSALRWFAADPFEYRRRIESLGRALHPAACTSILIDDVTAGEHQFHPRSLAHGVLILTTVEQDYGPSRRRLRVEKLRGEPVLSGHHDYEIRTGGLEVYPRIEIASKAGPRVDGSALLARRADFRQLLGGGVPWGSAVLIMGQAGTGKSSIAMTWAADALADDRSVLYLSFDEGLDSLLRRCRHLGIDAAGLRDAGRLDLEQVDPASASPGQVSNRIRQAVEQSGRPLAIVVLDSLSGYLHATGSSRYLDLQLHQLLDYLRSRGIITLMVLTQQGLLGDAQAPVDLSYISDVTVLTRFFEAKGSLHRAVSVVKHRACGHEQSIRELVFGDDGVRLGEPLSGFRGLLTGTPSYED